MGFAHIAIRGRSVHYRTKPRADYSVGGWTNFVDESFSVPDALREHQRDLSAGESVSFPYNPRTVRKLVALSDEDVHITAQDPEILKNLFGNYQRIGNEWFPYVSIVRRHSPEGAGIAVDARAPRDSHESLLHKFAARLLGYPADVEHHEHGESVIPKPAYPPEFERKHLGGNTFVLEPKKPEN